MIFYHNDLENNDDLTEEEIKKMKEEKLKELAKDQEEYIQKQYDRGIIPNYSKNNSNNIFNGNGKGTKLISKKEDEQENSKQEIVTYKYSQMGKGELHEAVILNGLPFFIKYNNITEKIELVEKIEENSRILRPPAREEYPYTPYEFETMDELEFYMEKAKQMTLDDLYIKCKSSIFSKYIDQDRHIIILLAADSIWTYFQDLFPTTHYLECVGDNDVGKSSIGYTFEYTGYRVIKGTAISGANYYRILGTDEPGQCVIIEDEGDNISDDPDKVKILKSGYEWNGKVPKINMNSKNQDQKWFKTYCYKMILAEKSLKESKVKGLVDRTLSGHCRPGKVKYSIKEVVSQNINKSPKLQKLYDELLFFRKLMICYRLIHYKDLLPEIETGLKNRDNELCHPLLQLFYNTKALNEIVETLENFVKQRRERRGNSLEAALYPIIKEHVFAAEGLDHKKNNYPELKQKKKLISIDYSNIWSFIITGEIEGYYDLNKKYQYETVNYGTLYNNSFSRFISDKFGAKLDKKSKGSVLEFDIEKLEKFENVYGSGKLEEDIKIEVKPKIIEEDDDEEQNQKNNDDGYDGYDGYDSYDGFRRKRIDNNSSNETLSNNTSKEDKEKEIINDRLSQKPSEPSEPSEPSSLNNEKREI